MLRGVASEETGSWSGGGRGPVEHEADGGPPIGQRGMKGCRLKYLMKTQLKKKERMKRRKTKEREREIRTLVCGLQALFGTGHWLCIASYCVMIVGYTWSGRDRARGGPGRRHPLLHQRCQCVRARWRIFYKQINRNSSLLPFLLLLFIYLFIYLLFFLRLWIWPLPLLLQVTGVNI